MLYFKAQSHLADAMASILRAQLRATSDTLAASMPGWPMWTQMLKAQSAGDDRRTLVHAHGSLTQHWSQHWSQHWPQHWPLQWPLCWSMDVTSWPWQADTCGAARLGFGPTWWMAPVLAFWVPSVDRPAWNVGPFQSPAQLSQRPPVSSAAPAGAGLNSGLNAGLDASFASYRSSGGHALAQVIVPPAAEELVEVTAKAALSPLGVWLGVWLAALGV